MPEVQLHLGDCIEILKTLPDASVDAVVTDPPYGLRFMGRCWDYDVPGEEVWRECLRVLRPGSILLSFGGTRTYHRMVCPIEDAGFFIEDSIHWIYGSGFPKHKSKLKPAHEPIVVARKPGPKWLNVDGCRVEAGERPNIEPDRGRITGNTFEGGLDGSLCGSRAAGTTTSGRWPANLLLQHSELCVRRGTKRVKGTNQPGNANGEIASGIGFSKEVPGKSRRAIFHTDPDDYGIETVADYDCHESCPIRLMGEQGGDRKGDSPNRKPRVKAAGKFGWSGDASQDWQTAGFADTGSPARFFPNFEPEPDPFLYCPKASRKDRGEGNRHPTVKPIALMRWLCRLATPPGGTVLDPFMGSGSTGVAAIQEGFDFVGIEREAEYHATAECRIAAARVESPLFAAV